MLKHVLVFLFIYINIYKWVKRSWQNSTSRKKKIYIYRWETIMTQRAENEKIKIHLKSNTYVLLLD